MVVPDQGADAEGEERGRGNPAEHVQRYNEPDDRRGQQGGGDRQGVAQRERSQRPPLALPRPSCNPSDTANSHPSAGLIP